MNGGDNLDNITFAKRVIVDAVRENDEQIIFEHFDWMTKEKLKSFYGDLIKEGALRLKSKTAYELNERLWRIDYLEVNED